MGRRIIHFSITIAIILLLAFMQVGCGNALLENLIVDVERATNNILIINTDGNGTTDPSGEVIVKDGEVVNISATPNSGYVFTSWTGTGITFGNRYAADTTVSLAGKTATITANFADENAVFDLDVQSAGNGSVEPSDKTPTLPSVPVIISATPDFGYEFVNWTGPLSAVFGDDTSANTTVAITENSVVKAHFDQLQYQLTVSNDGNGTTIPSGTQTVIHGDATQIAATPTGDNIFSDWSVESGSADIDDPSSASTTVTLISGDAEVKANFGIFKFYYGAWSSPAKIWRCFSDWTNHQEIHYDAGFIYGIVLDIANKYVYYTDYTNRTIKRCDFDGGNPIDLVTGAYPVSVYGIALDTTHDVLYWSDYGTREIKSVTLNPTGTPIVIADTTVQYFWYPQGMAFHNNKIFWVERQYRRIFEYDVATTGLTSWSIAEMSNPTDIAIAPSQGCLYCTDFVTSGNIYLYELASRTYYYQFAGPWNSPYGIAMDDPNEVMYITSPYDSSVWKVNNWNGSIINAFPQSGKAIKAIAVVPD